MKQVKIQKTGIQSFSNKLKASSLGKSAIAFLKGGKKSSVSGTIDFVIEGNI